GSLEQRDPARPRPSGAGASFSPATDAPAVHHRRREGVRPRQGGGQTGHPPRPAGRPRDGGGAGRGIHRALRARPRHLRARDAAASNAPAMSIRVLMADDHPIVRDGLRFSLERSGGNVEVVGEAADGVTLLELAETCPADVFILDLTMPRLNGLDTAREL